MGTLGIEARVRLTGGPGEARRLGREAAEGRSPLVVVLGGDGTLHEALNGIMEAAEAGHPLPRLAQVPLGTGNSFIKDLGIGTFEEGLSALEGGRFRRVDLGLGRSSAGAFWFINLTGAGFVARVARRAAFFKIFGDLAYTIAVLLELPGLRTPRLDLLVDGVASSRDAVFIEVCNSRKTGGDMIMAPAALVDDGRLDVVVARRMTRRQLLALFPLIFSGRHVESPLVETFTCSRIEARFAKPEPVTPDGELIGDTPLSIEVLPGAIEVCCR